jgi:hypothetical protein
MADVGAVIPVAAAHVNNRATWINTDKRIRSASLGTLPAGGLTHSRSRPPSSTGVNSAEWKTPRFSSDTPIVVTHNAVVCAMITPMAGRRGVVQRGRELRLDKLTAAGAKPRPVRAAAVIRADEPEAVKFIRMSNAAQVSGAELIRWLIRQARVDANGLPVGWPEEGQEGLPLTG